MLFLDLSWASYQLFTAYTANTQKLSVLNITYVNESFEPYRRSVTLILFSYLAYNVRYQGICSYKVIPVLEPIFLMFFADAYASEQTSVQSQQNNVSEEKKILTAIIDSKDVSTTLAMPGRLFFSNMHEISTCISRLVLGTDIHTLCILVHFYRNVSGDNVW